MGTDYSHRMENMVDNLEARVKELEHRDICSHCGGPATCMGAYEDERNIGFGCDNCCGHGNEDGWCVPVEEAGEKPIALRIVGIEAEARADKAEAAFGPLLPPSPEALEAYQRQAENYPESDMRAVPKQWLLNERSITERVAAELEKERDAALAEVERLRAVIDRAPHSAGCPGQQSSHSTGLGLSYPLTNRCNCWKREALEPKP